MMEWRDIESAPKDGFWLIGLDEFVGAFPICWCDIFNRWETPDQNFIGKEGKNGEWYHCEPTAWQPFPDPPKVD